MSGDGSVLIQWGDGEYRFRLGIGELRELQDKCDSGPLVVCQRLADGTWRVDDVREPLRLGLIGGGLDHQRALAKVSKYFVPTQFLSNVVAARRIMLAALFGDPEDVVGKPAGVETPPETLQPPAGDSGSQSSSETAQRWDGPSRMSNDAAYGNSPQRSMDGNAATVFPMTNSNPQP